MDVPVASAGWGFLKVLKFGLLFVFIGLILLEAVYVSVHQRSVAPFITTIGNRLAYSTNELSLASKEVISQGGIYKKTPDYWTGVWNFLKINYTFFISFYTLFMWIVVFAWLIARSPFSNKNNVFANYFFAVILFLLIQGIFILSMGAVNKTIDCFSGCDNSSIGYLISPVTSFKDFFIALEYILEPGFKLADDINKIPIINNSSIGKTLP